MNKCIDPHIQSINAANAEPRQIRLAYVMYNERICDGYISTQVLSLLTEIKVQAPAIEITLISFLPLWVAIKYRRAVNKVITELGRLNIKVKIYPWAMPYRLFINNVWRVSLARLWSVFIFRRVLGHRFNVVQGRSYFPSLIIACLQKELGYRSVFDLRSLFVEEQLSVGSWAAQDKVYALWRKWERWMLATMDVSIGVSAPMVEVMQQIAPTARAEMIPCCVDTRVFHYNAEARRRIRAEQNWNNRLVVVYEGSLGKYNDLLNYLAYFKRIVRLESRAFFLILTPPPLNEVKLNLDRAGLNSDQYLVRSARHHELSDWLSAADIGLQTAGMAIDRRTRLGIKFVEYLSCGLPVLCNSNVGGAAQIVREYKTGIAVDLDDVQADRKLAEFILEARSFREHCRQVAENLFSVQACARRYISLYTSV